MSYSCKILLDSISETGKRLTTFEITFPRIVLAELNTHRMFSRNSASSRAIPFKKQIEQATKNPFIPEKFPINKKGMQPISYYEKGSKEYGLCYELWLEALDNSIIVANILSGESGPAEIVIDFDNKTDTEVRLNVHKQIANRLLEPFQWHTVIITATEFSNFFKLRCDENAQYEIRRIADLMYEAYHAFENYDKGDQIVLQGLEWLAIRPQKLKVGEWHCPLVSEEDNEQIYNYLFRIGIDGDNKGIWQNNYIEIKKKISVARCARISYLTHDGKRDIEKDLELFERLRTSGHYSPFEHAATPSFKKISNEFAERDEFEQLRNGNFIGWRQMRQDLPNENCTNFKKE